MYKVAVMGDRSSIQCFKAFGVEAFPCIEDNCENNSKLLNKLAREDFGIIFVTEQVAVGIEETINRYEKNVTPMIVLIPSNKGSLNIGLNRISDNVEKAVGINILDEGR